MSRSEYDRLIATIHIVGALILSQFDSVGAAVMSIGCGLLALLYAAGAWARDRVESRR